MTYSFPFSTALASSCRGQGHRGPLLPGPTILSPGGADEYEPQEQAKDRGPENSEAPFNDSYSKQAAKFQKYFLLEEQGSLPEQVHSYIAAYDPLPPRRRSQVATRNCSAVVSNPLPSS